MDLILNQHTILSPRLILKTSPKKDEKIVEKREIKDA